MATMTHFYYLPEDIAEGAHNFASDQFIVALTNSAPNPDNNGVLTDISQISYTNCSSRNLTVASSAQVAGIYKAVFSDLTLTASGGSVGPFRYVVIYNDDTASDFLLGFYDLAQSITLADGDSFELDFDGSNGFLTLEAA